jgi:polyisoprenoid-binding protein YceI
MATQIWTFDTAHSTIAFSVRHMVISKVHGRFTKWSGSFAIDADTGAPALTDVTIETASIETNEAQRDAHLRSADFFDAERFPNIHFKSTGVTRAGDDFVIAGDLTIRGVTLPVRLAVESGGTGKDPWGNLRAGFSARTTINRKDFGLVWNAALETGGVLVGEKVEIAIEVEAIKAA